MTAISSMRHRLPARSGAHVAAIAPLLAILLGGCFSLSRVETDVYTITRRDTTVQENVINAPGDRDNGTIYPSPRTETITRRYTQQDSLVERRYPAFLRFGGIEAASFFAPGGSSQGAGNGLFGIYNLLSVRRKNDTKIFGANMYRIMPYEARLRWFNDEPNWTIGFSPYESFTLQRDSSSTVSTGEQLWSFANLYIRKRFFLRDRPPYVMAVPFFGLGVFPSQYVNTGVTLDVGSLGGFNLRGYAGFVGGTWLGRTVPSGSQGYGLAFPYFGLGVSTLDFVNKTEELFVEWKDQRPTALEVSGVNLVVTKSLSGAPAFGQDSAVKGSSPFTGLILRLASANVPLPFGERRFFLGTTLLNIMALSRDEIAIGFLPLRAGYRFNLYDEDLSLEPFAELNYYPSTAFQLGARVSTRVADWAVLDGYAAYVNGSANLDVLTGLEDLQVLRGYSAVYIGVGIGLGDVIYRPSEVRW
jgi:hypothetical protein